MPALAAAERLHRIIQRRFGIACRRGRVFERPLHHDEPGHFEHRIDVGFFEEALGDADIDAVDDRVRLALSG